MTTVTTAEFTATLRRFIESSDVFFYGVPERLLRGD